MPQAGTARAKTTRLRKGAKAFRPRARVIRALGQDLISNERVAIAELVKNAYDADASNVAVLLEGQFATGNGRVIVTDDGIGMTAEIIEGQWMEPATPSKIERPLSPVKKRRVTGEKGIGRFACAAVGRFLRIESHTNGSKVRVVAEIDWGQFDDKDRYLDEVKVNWHEEEADSSGRAGTKLVLSGLHRRLSGAEFRDFVEKLHNDLRRLVTPFRQVADFTIHMQASEEVLSAADLAEFIGPVKASEVLNFPPYRLWGRVDENGHVVGELQTAGHHIEFEPKARPTTLAKDANPGPRKESWSLSGPSGAPACGPFTFDIRIFDRETGDIEALAEASNLGKLDVRRALNAAMGISIYRDGFRILTQRDDWLGLDLRRVQNPTMRISNNQVVGLVELARHLNPGIVDQTNRQAVRESPAYASLQWCAERLVEKLEAYRILERSQPESQAKGMFGSLGFSALAQELQTRHPEDDQLAAKLNSFGKRLDATIREANEALSRYRRLATIGGLFDRLVHDGRHPLSRIANQLEKIQKMTDGRTEVPSHRLRAALDRIAAEKDLIASIFDRLEPFGGRRRGPTQVESASELVRQAFSVLDGELKAEGFELVLPENSGRLRIRCHAADVTIAIMNLIRNALYWTAKENPRGFRRIASTVEQLESGDVRIVISDNGPGVHPDFREKIWEPYFSMKPRGYGLGLSIVGETMEEHGGRAELLPRGPEKGATFALTFPGESE